MKHTYSLLLVLLLTVGISTLSYSQGSELYGKGIRLNVNEDGSKYIRFITWHQFWGRYTDNNPGTVVNGQAKAGTWDIGLRRSRFVWYTQISPRFLILAHIGINNQTFVNGGGSGTATTNTAGGGAAGQVGTGGYSVGKKPQLFIHDMWTEYTLIKDKFYIGTGLHYWNGVSRLASASTLNFLALDTPIFNWALIEESDQFARQFGIYAKGKLPIGKKSLDYRVAVNKPFATPLAQTNIVRRLSNPNRDTVITLSPDNVLKTTPNRAFSFANNSWAVAGYFSFELAEKESNVLPFTVGTYLGTKKVVNIGGGFHYNPNATRSFDTTSTTAGTFNNHNMLLLGLDVFADLPLNKEKGTAFTGLLTYLDYDFGPNYIRSLGIMNEGLSNIPGTLAQGGYTNKCRFSY
jgi:hypothetical protein